MHRRFYSNMKPILLKHLAVMVPSVKFVNLLCKHKALTLTSLNLTYSNLMLSTRNLLLSGLLLTAFFLSGWSAFITYYKKSLAAFDISGKSDAFMEEVVTTFIDKQGKPILTITSPRM